MTLTVSAPPGVGSLSDISGSTSPEFGNGLLNQTLPTLWLGAADEEQREAAAQAMLVALAGIKPGDEVEGMLAAQMIAAHSAAMECFRRAMISEQTFEGRREALSQANRLSRTYTTQMEALNRYRGKGQQKVTVEHVHVHGGGQAIVGAVNQGGGGIEKKGDQPHAHEEITHSPGTPMSRADPPGDAVPVTRDDERTLPHARR